MSISGSGGAWTRALPGVVFSGGLLGVISDGGVPGQAVSGFERGVSFGGGMGIDVLLEWTVSPVEDEHAPTARKDFRFGFWMGADSFFRSPRHSVIRTAGKGEP
jgi:hypothetical protein